MKHLHLSAALVALTAAAASADPVIDRIESVVAKGRRLDVTVEATFAAAGTVAISGDVNGIPVNVRKRMKAGHRVAKLRLDARKFRLRGLSSGVYFNLQIEATESAGAKVAQELKAVIPVPCIVLPGFGNETTPGAFAVFATGLNAAAGGIYTTSGDHPTLVVHEYPSQSASIANLGKGLVPDVAKALRGTVFKKVDLVGYSYGGIVARSFMNQGGASRVRNCVFLATPNEGTPLAYLAVGLSNAGTLDAFLGQNAALATLVQQFLTADAKQSLRNLYPTYPWALMQNPLTGRLGPVPTQFLEAVLGPSDTPLTAMNAIAPPPTVTFHAFYYTSTGLGQLGTVDTVDVSAMLTGGQIDPASVATGAGDGVAPAHSVTMESIPAWHGAIHPHDLGAGTHLTATTDLTALAGIAAIVGK